MDCPPSMSAEYLKIFFDVSRVFLSVTNAPSKAPHLRQGLQRLPEELQKPHHSRLSLRMTGSQ